MKVISTNIGEKQKVNYKGKNIETGIFKKPVNTGIELLYTDVNNDAVIDRRYHGGVDKACYLFGANNYEFWRNKYPNLKWEWGMFGENITVDELNEKEIFIGDIFEIGTALVQVTQPRQPCFKLGIRLNNSGAVKEFISNKLPGIYVRVLQMGKVKPNNNILLKEQVQNKYSVQKVFERIYNGKENQEEVKEIVKIKELADSCRKDLIKYSFI